MTLSSPSRRQEIDLGGLSTDQPQELAREAEPAALALSAIMLFYACLVPWLREYGVPALAFPVAATVALGLIYGRRYIQVTLIFLAALGTLVMALSWAGLMHQGLTLLFERSAIFQQGFYTVFLVFLIPACAHIWSRIESDAPGWRALEIIVLFVALSSKIALAVGGLRASDGGGFGISQLINSDMIALVIVARRYVFAHDQPLILKAALTVLLLATSGSLQSVLAIGALTALLAAPQFAKGIAAALIVSLFAAALGAQLYAQQIWWWDYNTGIRLLFWQDVYQRVAASWGLGVGFGTETIRPVYQIGIEEHVVSGLEREGYIFVAAHNAYVDGFYRLGLVGGGLLLFYFGKLFARTIDPARQSSQFDCFVCCTLAISLMVNVALASIGFVLGTGILAGWLVYRHADAEAFTGSRA